MSKSIVVLAWLSALALSAPIQAQNSSKQSGNSNSQTAPGQAGDAGAVEPDQDQRAASQPGALLAIRRRQRSLCRQATAGRSRGFLMKLEGIRVATHFFNDESDIERLLSGLNEIRAQKR